MGNLNGQGILKKWGQAGQVSHKNGLMGGVLGI